MAVDAGLLKGDLSIYRDSLNRSHEIDKMLLEQANKRAMSSGGGGGGGGGGRVRIGGVRRSGIDEIGKAIKDNFDHFSGNINELGVIQDLMDINPQLALQYRDKFKNDRQENIENNDKNSMSKINIDRNKEGLNKDKVETDIIKQNLRGEVLENEKTLNNEISKMLASARNANQIKNVLMIAASKGINIDYYTGGKALNNLTEEELKEIGMMSLNQSLGAKNKIELELEKNKVDSEISKTEMETLKTKEEIEKVKAQTEGEQLSNELSRDTNQLKVEEQKLKNQGQELENQGKDLSNKNKFEEIQKQRIENEQKIIDLDNKLKNGEFIDPKDMKAGLEAINNLEKTDREILEAENLANNKAELQDLTRQASMTTVNRFINDLKRLGGAKFDKNGKLIGGDINTVKLNIEKMLSGATGKTTNYSILKANYNMMKNQMSNLGVMLYKMRLGTLGGQFTDRDAQIAESFANLGGMEFEDFVKSGNLANLLEKMSEGQQLLDRATKTLVDEPLWERAKANIPIIQERLKSYQSRKTNYLRDASLSGTFGKTEQLNEQQRRQQLNIQNRRQDMSNWYR